MRTRKRRDPRMRQRTPGKEKIPGRGLETGLDPKENKATGYARVHSQKWLPTALLFELRDPREPGQSSRSL